MDNRFFSAVSNNNDEKQKENLMKYLKNTEEFLDEEYDEKFKDFKEILEKKIPDFQNLIQIFIGEVQFIMTTILNDLDSLYNEEDCDFEKIIDFNILDKNNKIILSAQEEISKFLMNNLIDLISGEKDNSFKIIINEVMEGKLKVDFYNQLKIPKVTKICEKFFRNIRSEIEIINIIFFLKKLNKKFNKLKKKTNWKNLCEFDVNKVSELFIDVKGNICIQKCPFCCKICGEENDHKYHQCIYGHQIRGIGGVKLKNDEAAITICEEMDARHQICFNGKIQTWGEVKEYFKTREINPWLFEDKFKKQELKKLKEKCLIPWRICGEMICLKYGIKYVDLNTIEIGLKKNVHYIFNIDSSG